ncbi:nitroreductase family deazaflavin-dependent oxidoreductase [Devosia sp.]|uniref:nitroreductase family deazaflavin-dependent oxidoreductase n=1 Tax=Devosia sp. TaxID=1871048 RepID=UPI003A8D8F69
MSDFNDMVMADFHRTKGKPGGPFEGKPVLLLHAIGAKSGADRTLPLMYLQERQDDRWYVFASYGGAPSDPDWYHNLIAHPDIEISVGDGSEIERLPVHASEIEGGERDAIYARQATLYPQFAEYEEKTDRTIPVIALARR